MLLFRRIGSSSFEPPYGMVRRTIQKFSRQNRLRFGFNKKIGLVKTYMNNGFLEVGIVTSSKYIFIGLVWVRLLLDFLGYHEHKPYKQGYKSFCDKIVTKLQLQIVKKNISWQRITNWQRITKWQRITNWLKITNWQRIAGWPKTYKLNIFIELNPDRLLCFVFSL